MSNPDYHYQVGDQIPLGSLNYVTRNADRKLLKFLKDGKFCYVLSSRQVGKTSLLVHTQHELEEKAITCINISMQGIIDGDCSDNQIYNTIVNCIIQNLDNLQVNSLLLKESWEERQYIDSSERFNIWIEQHLFPRLKSTTKQLVILIDEIDYMIMKGQSFAKDFFLALEKYYQTCQTNNDFAYINFGIFGVCTPSNLIEKNESFLFNNGQKIILENFDTTIARNLRSGLMINKQTPARVFNAILYWTGGQPFLTQKVCKIIQEINNNITDNQVNVLVENIIREKIIKNWVHQDYPEHFRSIKGIITQRNTAQETISTLKEYERILQERVYFDKSCPQQEILLLSGIVANQDGYLIVSNKIYQNIFNKDWLEQELKSLSPFADKFKKWSDTDNKSNYLIEDQNELNSCLKWSLNTIVSPEEKKFLKSSINRIEEINKIKQEEENKIYEEEAEAENTRRQTDENKQNIITILICFLLFASGLSIYLLVSNKLPWSTATLFPQKKELFSSGEQRLFTNKDDLSLNNGVRSFQNSEYDQAISNFQAAIDGARNHPEAKIYLNNAIARQESSQKKEIELVKIAVIVPVENDTLMALEILRGVADAQTEFNQAGNNINLEIIIFNDRNSPEQAAKIAHQLAETKYRDIVGVIIHKLSHLNTEQLKKFDHLNVPIISIASTSILKNTQNRNIFSVVFKEEEVAKDLARKIKELEIKDIALFYDNQSNKSSWMADSLEKEIGKDSVKKINLSHPNLDAKTVFQTHCDNRDVPCVEKDTAKALVLLPGSDTTSMAIAIAKANKDRLKLFGGDILYQSNTLINGGEDVEGLILAVPWFADTNNEYAKKYQEEWGGVLSWRTAMGYDATKTLTEALSINKSSEKNAPSRTILEILRDNRDNTFLSNEKTSGTSLTFSFTGERKGDPVFVIVAKDAPKPNGVGYGFKLLE